MNKNKSNLKKVKSKDTKMELKVRRKLWEDGLRYRKNFNRLLGKPDIAFPNLKFVVFLDSCFWHGCPKHFRVPPSNEKFWIDKIKKNQERDQEQTQHYIEEGWIILRYWEHEIDNEFSRVIEEIEKKYYEIKQNINS